MLEDCSVCVGVEGLCVLVSKVVCVEGLCECWTLVGVFGFGRLVGCVGVDVSRVCVGRS